MRTTRAIGAFIGLLCAGLSWPASTAAAQAAGTAAGTADILIANVAVPDWHPSPSTVQLWLEVTNAGPYEAAGVAVRLALPDGVDAISGSWQRWSGDEQSAGECAVSATPYQVVCSVGSVPAGSGTGVNAVVVNRSLPAGTAVQLSASVSTDSLDPVPSNNAAVVPVTFPGEPLGDGPPDLRVSIDGSQEWSPSVAALFVSVVNGGASPAADTELVATVPEGVSVRARSAFVGTDASYGAGDEPVCSTSADRRSVTCVPAEALRIDQRLYVGLIVANTGVPAGSVADVRVEVRSSAGDAQAADNVLVRPIAFSGPAVAFDAADLAVRLAGDPPAEWAQPADGVANRAVMVTSGGPAVGTAVELSVEAPDGVRLVSHLRDFGGTQFRCEVGPANRLRCTFDGPIDHDVPLFLPFAALNVGLPAGTTVELLATVRHGEADPDTTNDSLALPVTFNGAPVPTIAAGPSAEVVIVPVAAFPYEPESSMSFLWTLISRGPDPAGSVSVVVQLSPGLTFRGAYLDLLGASCAVGEDPATVVCTAALMPVGRPLMLSVHTGWDADSTRAVYEAEAFVATDLPDPIAGNNRAKVRGTVPGATPDVSVTVAGVSVTAAPALPATGGTSTWMPTLGVAAVAVGLALGRVAITRRRPDGAHGR